MKPTFKPGDRVQYVNPEPQGWEANYDWAAEAGVVLMGIYTVVKITHAAIKVAPAEADRWIHPDHFIKIS